MKQTSRCRSKARAAVLLPLEAAVILTVWLAGVNAAYAVPSFARQYDVSCNACHTREPRLNPFGQRFQENGYQMPGTEDGGVALKDLFGGPLEGVRLADVSDFLAVRLRADVEQAGLREATAVREDVNVVFPSIINLFFAGTATRNISFFLEGEFATRPEEEFGFERAMLIFDNLGGHQLANLKVGRFDPSAFFSFPTHRQQLNPVPPVAETADFPPAIDRAPLLPLAFASKMFGLTRGPSREGTEGFAILPFEPFLFNAPARTGATLYGRPFGPSFLYQVGVSQDETAEDDPDTRWDPYVMLRYDVLGRYSDVQVSAFYHYARDAARPTLRPGPQPVFAGPVDWHRFGLGLRWHYRFLDIYGTGIWDKIGDVEFAAAPASLFKWDTNGFGASVEVDWLLTRKWLLGTRYDFMDPGGLEELPPALQAGGPKITQDASFLGAIAKYYPVPNIGLYARGHFNLAGSEDLPAGLGGAEHPARNLTYLASLGVDMAF